jgi:hypothetical protein
MHEIASENLAGPEQRLGCQSFSAGLFNCGPQFDIFERHRGGYGKYEVYADALRHHQRRQTPVCQQVHITSCHFQHSNGQQESKHSNRCANKRFCFFSASQLEKD